MNNIIFIKTSEELENDSCKLYSPEDKLIGEVTTGLSLTDICVQIKEQSLEGYYLLYNNDKMDIFKDGRVSGNIKIFPKLGEMLRVLI